VDAAANADVRDLTIPEQGNQHRRDVPHRLVGMERAAEALRVARRKRRRQRQAQFAACRRVDGAMRADDRGWLADGGAQLADRVACEELRGHFALRRASGLQRRDQPLRRARQREQRRARSSQRPRDRVRKGHAPRRDARVAQRVRAGRRQRGTRDEAQMDAFGPPLDLDRRRGEVESRQPLPGMRLDMAVREQSRQRGNADRFRAAERSCQGKHFNAVECVRRAQELLEFPALREHAGKYDRRGPRIESRDQDDRYREERRSQCRRRFVAALDLREQPPQMSRDGDRGCRRERVGQRVRSLQHVKQQLPRVRIVLIGVEPRLRAERRGHGGVHLHRRSVRGGCIGPRARIGEIGRGHGEGRHPNCPMRALRIETTIKSPVYPDRDCRRCAFRSSTCVR